LIEDSKREFNYKIIMHLEFIDTLYKSKVKKNKDKDFEDKISEIISSIVKTEIEIEYIK
jgi:hypothetical protein